MSEVPRQNPQEESESAKAFKNAMELLRGNEGAAEAPKAPEPVAKKEAEPMSAKASFEKAENDAFLARFGELVKQGKLDEAERALKERNDRLRGGK